MNIVNKVEVKLEKYKKCHLITDADCPMGEIYDYTCALIAFCIQRMQEAQPKPAEEVPAVEVPEESQPE